MAHHEQRDFCERVRRIFPHLFQGIKVVDFGSLNINGGNREYFKDCEYVGVDLGAGSGVDVVCAAHRYKPKGLVDVVISTEMLEHDRYWMRSLRNMVDILRPGGLLLFTCATAGRLEHGTKRRDPDASPHTTNYYRNLSKGDVEPILNCDQEFAAYAFEIEVRVKDLYFWGLKKYVDLSDLRTA